ncbi:MAG: NADH-quinone oxidoreductase subunit L [Actinomycetota bacterium]|nr:NADH-quinone oxidoreductase subunit L [Actinomycetota bacterium]
MLAPVLLVAEGANAELSSGGILASAAWLIPVVPLVAAWAIALFGKRFPLKGWDVAIAVMGFEAVYGTVLLLSHIANPIGYEGTIEIARIGSMPIEWGWTVDGLSIMMYSIVGVVGFLVFLYARGYMEGDIRYTWFFASFTLFAGGMLVLVSAPNLIQLIVGWELVGVSSWLLIGHYWEEHENSSAAIKAFLVNRVGDIGLFIGAIIVSVSVGSFRFSDVLDGVESGAPTLARYAFWGGLALFIGAMGKSAQFPLHVWLPDAMAGPTPVSALMHAATMVTAGVYLVGRVYPLYLTEGFADEVRSIIIVVGALTLFLTGLIALVQNDIKKVLAYSTLSQLGYMTAAMGAGAYTAGLFHLFTHAFFKALLFLGAGSVIHAVHSNNLSDMGGLRKDMPWTFRTFVVGSLALAGILPLAGFFSKDEILASLRFAGSEESGFTAAQGGAGLANLVLVLAIAGAFVTAFYMARTVFLTFYGTYQGHGHPHESPKVMWVPLAVLGFFSIVAGWINIPGITSTFTDVVGARFHLVADHHAESFDYLAMVLGLAAAVGGIALGYRLWFPDKATQAERDTFTIPGLYPLLSAKYHIDTFYMDGIIRPIRGPVAGAVNWVNGHVIDFVVNGAGLAAMALGRGVYVLDQQGVDGAINAAGAATGAGGGVLRRMQSGRIEQYATWLIGGTVALVAGFIIFS